MSLDDLQAQLRGALDQQFANLKQHYEQAITDVKRQAAADAERNATARLQAARKEWESALNTIVEAARAETKQQADEAARAQRNALEHQLQQQLEQTVQHAMNSVKKTSELEIQALRRRVEQDVEAERQKGQAAVEEEKRRAQQALEAERERVQQERLGERERAQEESRVERERAEQQLAERDRAQQELQAERARMQQDFHSAREQAARDLDAERARAKSELETVQELLEAEIAAAKAEAALSREAAERAAADVEAAQARAAASEAAAVAAAVAAATPPAPAVPAALARVPDAVRAIDAARSLSHTLEALLQHAGAIAGRAALFLINDDRLQAWKTVAIPEIDVQTVESSIGGRDLLARAIQMGQAMTASPDLPAPPFARLATDRPAVAIPLAIKGRAVAVVYADAGTADPAAGWVEAIDLVTRHASAIAALRAAVRTLDVLGGDASDPSLALDAPTGNGNGEESARRYARLLVSEIKLYNEAAVRAGRQQRDLRQRLRSEIDRAQRLYEERVPPAVGARDQLFHQELVQTLADGDPTLLGS